MMEAQMIVTPTTVDDCVNHINKLHIENHRGNHDRWQEIQEYVLIILSELNFKSIKNLYDYDKNMLPFNKAQAYKYMKFDRIKHSEAKSLNDLKSKPVTRKAKRTNELPINTLEDTSLQDVEQQEVTQNKAGSSWDDYRTLKIVLPPSCVVVTIGTTLKITGFEKDLKSIKEKIARARLFQKA